MTQITQATLTTAAELLARAYRNEVNDDPVLAARLEILRYLVTAVEIDSEWARIKFGKTSDS